MNHLENIYPKIQKIVKNNSFVKNKFLQKPKKYDLLSINKVLKKYHKHISLTENIFKKNRKVKNKMPKFQFNKKNKIISLTYYTYIYDNNKRFYRKYIKYV